MTGSEAVEVPVFYSDALVWDYHACLPLEPDSPFIEELVRYRRAGVNVLTINIGDSHIPFETQVAAARHFRRWIGAHDGYRVISTAADIEEAHRAGDLAVCFDVEGVAAVEGDLGRVAALHALGVRWMLLVYNKRNLAGYGCHDDEDLGLTDFGRRLIAEMDRVGIIKDCSHTGYRTACDVLEASPLPITFSHSNARALRDHPRNIPDDLMRACAATGGVVGINGVGIFLGDNEATAEAMLRHIDHAVQLIGPEHVGIGTDYVFDPAGMDAILASAPSTWPARFGYRPGIRFVPPEAFPELAGGFVKLGYSETDVRGILGLNFLRVAKAVWKQEAAPPCDQFTSHVFQNDMTSRSQVSVSGTSGPDA